MCNECLEIKSDTLFEEWYFENNLYREYAIKCKALLDKMVSLKPYEARKHKKGKYVCWYVGFKDNHEEKICLILRPEIRKSDICFYFQSPKNVSKDTLKHGEKANSIGWLPVKYNNYKENELIKMIKGYLKNVKENWEEVEKSCQKRRPCENQKTRS